MFNAKICKKRTNVKNVKRKKYSKIDGWLRSIIKYLYDLSAPIMKEVFTKRLKYNLRNCRVTLLPNPKTKITALIR